jgi:hypothetical protein
VKPDAREDTLMRADTWHPRLLPAGRRRKDQSSKLFFVVFSFVISVFLVVKSFLHPAPVNVQDGRHKIFVRIRVGNDSAREKVFWFLFSKNRTFLASFSEAPAPAHGR